MASGRAGNPWIFSAEEVAETPSRLDGVSEEDEFVVVSTMSRYLFTCARELHVPQTTGAVAIKFLQRVFQLESLRRVDCWGFAMACFFLACKTQETNYKLGKVIYVCVREKTRGSPDFPDGEEVLDGTERFFEEKERMIARERDTLRILNFDLYVEHPYWHIRQHVQTYFPRDGDRRRVLQAAYNFVNDSFKTYLHMRFEEREIASVAVYFAARYCALELPDGTQRDANGGRIRAWHEFFQCDIERIDTIGHSMMDFYEKVLSGKLPEPGGAPFSIDIERFPEET